MDFKYVNELFFLTEELEKFGKLSIVDNQYYFFDEPNLYTYSLVLEPNFKYKNSQYNYYPIVSITACGQSFFNKELALLKGVNECIERMCLYIFPRNVITGKYGSIQKPALNPGTYDPELIRESFDWIEGENLTKDKKCFIPAQLVYLGYGVNSEKKITCQNSTGAACSDNRESAILRGIYEIIERDAFMCVYLNKIAVPKIDIESIGNSKITEITQLLHRFNLNIEIFNITNDLGIPTILSVVSDYSSIGPYITVGIKTDHNPIRAIIGAIEEAVVRRVTIRGMMKRNELKEKVFKIDDIAERASFWLSPSMLKNINFLFDSNEKDQYDYNKLSADNKGQLTKIINNLGRLGFSIYTTCISQGKLPEEECMVYKTVIPGLQPLYQSEREKTIIKERIIHVSNFFSKKSLKINAVPHPFI